MRILREGFTTGTAASAAAFASVCRLLGARPPALVDVALPPFSLKNGCWILGKTTARLAVPIEQEGINAQEVAHASVIKDGGDDPDATHGARIVAYTSRRPFQPNRGGINFLEEPFSNVALGTFSCSPVEVKGFANAVTLYGGRGVGIVTLPGLPVAPGEPAINPWPRRQIAAAAVAAATLRGYRGRLHVLISVPDGEARALRTLNGRLGIAGGLSILGTCGTVLPYSHEAWKATIVQGLSVASALDLDTVLLATGRRSERLAFALHPGLSPQACVPVADHAAFALTKAVKYNFTRILWSCFSGKLLKLAQGLEWTHARGGKADISRLARYCREGGAAPSLVAMVESMPTAAGTFSLLEEQNKPLHDALLQRLAREALAVMRGWMDRASVKALPLLTLHVFSAKEILLLTHSEPGNYPTGTS